MQAAYDKWLKAKYAAKKRHQELNAKRRKLKESVFLNKVALLHDVDFFAQPWR